MQEIFVTRTEPLDSAKKYKEKRTERISWGLRGIISSENIHIYKRILFYKQQRI